MDVTIRTDDADAAGSLKAWLDGAGQFEPSVSGSRSVGVVAGAGKVSVLASALAAWLNRQPPGSGVTVEANMQDVTVRAGDPLAAVVLTETLMQEELRAQGPSGLEEAPPRGSGSPMFGPPPGPDFDSDA